MICHVQSLICFDLVFSMGIQFSHLVPIIIMYQHSELFRLPGYDLLLVLL